MKPTRLLPLALFLCSATRVALAHGGGLDASGGHVDHRTGLYHFHGGGGGFSPPAFNPPAYNFGGLGTVYSPPAPRRRARMTARIEPRTTARTSAGRQEPIFGVTPNEEAGTGTGAQAETPAGSATSSRPVDGERAAQELLRLAKLLGSSSE